MGKKTIICEICHEQKPTIKIEGNRGLPIIQDGKLVCSECSLDGWKFCDECKELYNQKDIKNISFTVEYKPNFPDIITNISNIDTSRICCNECYNIKVLKAELSHCLMAKLDYEMSNGEFYSNINNEEIEKIINELNALIELFNNKKSEIK